MMMGANGVFDGYLQPISYQMVKGNAFELSDWKAVFGPFGISDDVLCKVIGELAVFLFFF